VIQADFGTQHNRAADVLRGIQRIFRVLRGESGALSLLVIEEIDRNPVMNLELISRFT